MFPEEIFDQILSFLEFSIDKDDLEYNDSENRATLHTACVVNKTFQRLATPRLYESVLLRPKAIETPLLLRTLLDRPELVSCVRNLSLQRAAAADRDDGDAIQDLHKSSDYSVAVSRIKQDVDLDQLEINDEILLLATCTSIRSLTLEMDDVSRELFDSFVEILEDAGLRYQHLTKVQVGADPQSGRLPNVQGLLRIPSLEVFVGRQLYSGEYTTISSDISSNIIRVELYDSAFEAVGITRLLTVCPKLRSLTLEWAADLMDEGEDLDFQDIGVSLRTHGTGLESVDLQAQHAWFLSSGHDPPPPFGDLSSLASLCHFAAPATAFFTTAFHSDESGDSYRKIEHDFDRNFPKSLQTLKIYDAFDEGGEAEWNQLEKQLLLLMGDSTFSNLRSITIEIVIYGFHYSRPSLKGLSFSSGWSLTVHKAEEEESSSGDTEVSVLVRDL